MAVAVAVLSGAADVGLGIYAAARALDLDFIPVVTEQYDLVIPETYFGMPNMTILLDQTQILSGIQSTPEKEPTSRKFAPSASSLSASLCLSPSLSPAAIQSRKVYSVVQKL